MKHRVLKIMTAAAVIVAAQGAAAQTETYRNMSYTYQASDYDNDASAQARAIELLREQAMRKAGQYVQSTLNIKSNSEASEHFDLISPSKIIVEIKKQGWDPGERYVVSADVTVDMSDVKAYLRKMRDNPALVDSLKKAKAQFDATKSRITALGKELDALSNAMTAERAKCDAQQQQWIAQTERLAQEYAQKRQAAYAGIRRGE